MVSGFDPHGPRDAVFVPVGLNYDRVLEDRIQVGALPTSEGEKPRFRFSPAVLIGFIANRIKLRWQGRLYRYGYACVSFGRPISLRRYCVEHGLDLRLLNEKRRFAEVERLGQMLMRKVGEVVPALPVPLVAAVILGAAKPLSALELKSEVEILIRRLIANGAHIHIPRADQDYAIEVGLRTLLLRHFVLEENGLYRANPGEEIMLRYYANSIAHLLRDAATATPIAAE
jgi:glycerol-3-phosphate O-acyltransferase